MLHPLHAWAYPPYFYALVLPFAPAITTVTVEVARGLLHGLEALHGAKTMHGDVKPSNMGVLQPPATFCAGNPPPCKAVLFDLDTGVYFPGQDHLRTRSSWPMSFVWVRCVGVCFPSLTIEAISTLHKQNTPQSRDRRSRR